MTHLSLIGNPRWSDVVEDETGGRRSEGVKDSLPLTKARGISNLSHEGYIPVSEKLQTTLEGIDLLGLAPQTAGSSNLDSLGFQDIQARLASGEDWGVSLVEIIGVEEDTEHIVVVVVEEVGVIMLYQINLREGETLLR